MLFFDFQSQSQNEKRSVGTRSYSGMPIRRSNDIIVLFPTFRGLIREWLIGVNETTLPENRVSLQSTECQISTISRVSRHYQSAKILSAVVLL